MAIQGPIPLEFGVAFPDGVYAAGAFEPVRDFDRSQGDRFVQQLDKATGQPLWAVEVIDADPQARARTVKVKVISPHQPVLPPAASGAPFVPVEFTGLTVTPVCEPGRAAGVLGQGHRGPGTGCSRRPGGPGPSRRHRPSRPGR